MREGDRLAPGFWVKFIWLLAISYWLSATIFEKGLIFGKR
jgi:hypothetical protein